MGFKLDDELFDKVNGILNHIEEELNIEFSDFTFAKKGEEYLRTKVTNETCFKKAKTFLLQTKILSIHAENYYKRNLFFTI